MVSTNWTPAHALFCATTDDDASPTDCDSSCSQLPCMMYRLEWWMKRYPPQLGRWIGERGDLKMPEVLLSLDRTMHCMKTDINIHFLLISIATISFIQLLWSWRRVTHIWLTSLFNTKAAKYEVYAIIRPDTGHRPSLSEKMSFYSASAEPVLAIVNPSVCLSVRHTLALYQNDSSYNHGVFTVG